jgi:hypothetical protein
MSSNLDKVLVKWQLTAFNLYYHGKKDDEIYNQMLNEVLKATEEEPIHPSVEYMNKFKCSSNDGKLYAIMMHKFH